MSYWGSTDDFRVGGSGLERKTHNDEFSSRDDMKIRDYKSLDSEERQKVHKVSINNWSTRPRRVEVDLFSFSGNKWVMILFPQGNDKAGFVAAYVGVSDPDKLPIGGLKVSITISVWNQRMNVVLDHSRNVEWALTRDCVDRGFSDLIPTRILLDREQGYIANDTVIFEIKVALPDNRISSFQPMYSRWSNYDSKTETGFVGLKNQGATCYMNSLLQNLFNIPYFRNAVYQMPWSDSTSKERNIPWNLQKLFYHMQTSKTSIDTRGLTASFGWEDRDVITQHDIQEFSRLLCDNLEEKMKGTSVDGTIKKLFEGTSQTFIECLNVNYRSVREESFYDLSMTVKGLRNLQASFLQYTEVEQLTGSNQYRAEGHGLQDARKGLRFLKFPPILQMQLKRFEYDPYRDAMVKINERFEFPTELDLTPFLANVEGADRSVPPVYILHSVLVHSGNVHGGHYYAYVRPSLTNRQWYKFDDDIVTKVDEKEAVEDNFGGQTVDPYYTAYGVRQTYVRSANAYMLVYIRKAEAPELLAELKDSDIPESLKSKIDEDKVEQEEKRKRDKEAINFTNANVLLDRDIREKHVNALELGQDKHARQFKIRKEETLKELGPIIEAETNIPVASQSIWIFTRRQNETVRPNNLAFGTKLDLKFGSDLYAYMRTTESTNWPERQTFLLRENPEPDFAETWLPKLTSNPSEAVLIMLKFFDVRTQTLQYVGSRIVLKTDLIGSLQPVLRALAQPRLNDNTPLVMVEEAKPGKVASLNPDVTFQSLGFYNGDIICYQEYIDDSILPSIRTAWEGEAPADGSRKPPFCATMQEFFLALHQSWRDDRDRASQSTPSRWSAYESRSMKIHN